MEQVQRVVLPDLSGKLQDISGSSRPSLSKSLSSPNSNGVSDDHAWALLRSGAATERYPRTARNSRRPTEADSGPLPDRESRTPQTSRQLGTPASRIEDVLSSLPGFLTQRGTQRVDHRWHSLKSSGSWRPKKDAKGPMVQFLLKSAWGSAADNGSLHGNLEDVLREKCGEDPQISAWNMEAESLEVAVKSLQRTYNDLKHAARSKAAHLAAISTNLRDLRELSGDGAGSRSPRKAAEAEDSKLLLLSRPSFAGVEPNADEDPFLYADRVQEIVVEEERQLRVRVHCERRYVLEKARLLDSQKQQQELLRRLTIECADQTHSVQIRQEEEEKAKASIAVFTTRIDALIRARARVAEAIALRHAAFDGLRRKMEQRKRHKESLISKIKAEPGKVLQRKATAVEEANVAVPVLRDLNVSVHIPKGAVPFFGDGHEVLAEDLNKVLKRHEDNQNNLQALQKEIAAAEAQKRHLQATRDALEAALEAAACLPQRTTQFDERTRKEIDALDQRQSTMQSRQDEAVRKWAETETQIAAAVSGVEGLIHLMDPRATVPTSPLVFTPRTSAGIAAGPSHGAAAAAAAAADVVQRLELRVKEVLMPMLTSSAAAPAASAAHEQAGKPPSAQTGGGSISEGPSAQIFSNYRLGVTGPKGTPPESRRTSGSTHTDRLAVLTEAYLEAKAAASSRAQTAVAAKQPRLLKTGSKLQTQLSGLPKKKARPSRASMGVASYKLQAKRSSFGYI